MPIYRDHEGKLRFDGIIAAIYSALMICVMFGTSIGGYYAFKSVTMWRLEKCETDNVKCQSGIKEVSDRLTNHSMSESGTQATIATLKETVSRLDTKLDAILSLSKQTRESQKQRGY